MQRSRICRFGNQSIYDIMGRDPISSPLSSYELALFERSLYEVVSKEYSSGDDDSKYPDEIPEEYQDLDE